MSTKPRAKTLRERVGPQVQPAAALTAPVAEQLKQRIIGELYPCLVEDLLCRHPGDKQPVPLSPNLLSDVQHRSQIVLLRLLIVSIAAARGLANCRGKSPSSWPRLGHSASLYLAGRKIDEDRWRTGIDRCWHAYFQATGRTPEPLPCLSTSVLAKILGDLSWQTAEQPGGVALLDDKVADLRLLGEVYQRLLSTTIDQQTGRLAITAERRKASGTFYTPAAVIDYIVKETLGPVLARGVKRPRVLDPAMGCGYFLLIAVEHIAQHWRSQFDSIDASAERRLMRRAAECLYGLDIDPIAVEVAQAALWLQCGFDRRSMLGVRARLRCGNALLDERFDDPAEAAPTFPNQFDAVIGNPPYGAKLSTADRRLACQRLPQMRHNSDTAVGFLERSHAWLSPGGRCGLIVPKALTYSFSWRRLREHLAGCVVELVDVSRAWADVRLEQVILLSAADNDQPSYGSRIWRDGELSPRVTVERELTVQIDAWPCGLTRDQQRFVHRLSRSPATVGDVCRTFRGLPLQAKLTTAGTLPVLGGRDLVRWGVRSISGHGPQYIDPLPFAGPRLLFQNIVAHLVRPHPQIRLIGCHDGSGRATLDTVNNLVARRDDVDLHGVLGLLHAPFMNWYVYAVIYNQAIRTMHFDQYFLNKIPLPPNWQRLLDNIAPLSASIEQSVAEELACNADLAARELESLRDGRRRAELQIDELVNQAYGWRPDSH